MNKQIENFCKTKHLYTLIDLPFYVQQLFLYYAQKKLSKKIDIRKDQMLLSKKIVNFFYTMPINYKPKLHNFGNTCWVSASIWFMASMQLLLNMLYNCKEKDSLHPVLKFLSINMNINTDIDNRQYAISDIDTFKESCVVLDINKKLLGEQLDISDNVSAIIDIIPDKIKNQLFCTSNIKNNSKLVFNNVETDKKKVYKKLIKQLNQIAFDIRENENFSLEINQKYFSDKNSDIEVKLDLINDTKFFKDIFPNKKRLSIDLYCNNVDKTDSEKRICDFLSTYKSCIILQEFTPSVKKNIINYELILPISNYFSVQEYFDSILSNPINTRIDEYKLFNIKRLEQIDINIKHKSYIIIKLGYNYTDNNRIVLPNNFTIQEKLKVQNINFVLTAVGMKSGKITGGHWWCLVKNINSNNQGYIKYDDMDNDNAKIVDIDKINKFSNSKYASLLCYTWNGI